MQIPARLLVVAFALGMAACAGPLDGWHVAQGPRLALHLAGSGEEARDALVEVEEMNAALSQALFPQVVPVEAEIVVFATAEDQRRAVDAATSAGKTPADRSRPIALTARIDGTRRARRGHRGGANLSRTSTPQQQQAARALAALYLDARVPRAPAWLRAGILSYAETVVVGDGTVDFGRRLPWSQGELQAGHILPLSKLVSTPASSYTGLWRRAYDASAWAFVHFMENGDGGANRARFDRFMDALARAPGPREEAARAAIEAAFPGEPIEALDTRVRDYAIDVLAARPGVAVVEQPFTAPPLDAVSVRAESEDEVAAVLGTLGTARRTR